MLGGHDAFWIMGFAPLNPSYSAGAAGLPIRLSLQKTPEKAIFDVITLILGETRHV